jgi:hypothetical protein
MSRRAAQQEPGFGSDSFLDIIANLVGILIILIVLAGLRASQSSGFVDEEIADKESLPQELEPLETEEPIEPTAVSEPIELASDPSPPVIELPAAPEPALPKPPAPEPVRLASDEELSELRTLKARIGQLHRSLAIQDVDDAKEELAAAQREQDGAAKKLALLESAKDKAKRRQQEVEQAANQDAAGLANLKRRLDQVNEQLVAVSNQQPKQEQLAHRITPVGQVVKGPELHFRLSENRISRVPIGELIEEVKEKVQSNGAWLSKFNKHQGKAGPVDGYQLKYAVERVAVNKIGGSGQRGGGTMIRLSVTEFTVEPLDNLVEQSIDQALALEGTIVRAIQENPPTATLTVWVYPDSFGSYRRIANFAQRNGIKIAGRPLPKGMAISGSPNGSQSVGQ